MDNVNPGYDSMNLCGDHHCAVYTNTVPLALWLWELDTFALVVTEIDLLLLISGYGFTPMAIWLGELHFLGK